jgi:hypothetical protein
LARALRAIGVDAYAEDLDLASPTLEFIKGKKGWETRLSEKREWTMDLAREASSIFMKTSEKYAVVIGDAPGKITAESKEIVKNATHGIILCREDCVAEIKNWQELLAQLKVQTICIAVSKMHGTGDVKANAIIKATITGLDRKPKIDEVIDSLAVLIKKKLRL